FLCVHKTVNRTQSGKCYSGSTEKVTGELDDCACDVETIDGFNNEQLFPKLQTLLESDYFRFYKVNLNKPCPFWTANSHCGLRDCAVKPCSPVNEESPDSRYVDLLLNPERYTGYKGPEAWQIWNSIYEENCFKQRFDSDLTVGEGPKRLRNLYFLYLIELRALAKVLPFFKQPSFRLYTGRTEEDQKHKELLLDILQLARSVYKPKEN
ncbi:hypothetical protein XENOCAPTIV_017819, partial [Xenoophorus captivus]